MTARLPAFYLDNLGGRQNHRTFKVKKPRKGEEHKFQAGLVTAIRRANPRAMFRAIPNGGARHIRVAMKLKAEGVKRGTPDLVFLLDAGRTAWLELKAKSGVLSPEQEDFRDACRALGHLWEFAKDFDTAWGILAGWGVVPSEVKRVCA